VTIIYRLVLDGSLPAGVTDLLRGRFEGVQVCSVAVHTVIECPVVDQSALRSLMTQLWDVGGTVLLLAAVPRTEGTHSHDHD
jgi:hypothetical protein